MAHPVDSPYLVPFDGSFRIQEAPTRPPEKAPGKKAAKARLARQTKRLEELQYLLYAVDRRSLLLVFQGMDAAGKDGVIRSVLSGVNPAGCQVSSFKHPSAEELDHDFLWRVAERTPERGRIGVFNRSHYEEVLIVRVHPEILDSQQLPRPVDHAHVFEHRYESIRDFEQHLSRSGTVILKFWLNVSRDEQKRRFLDRIDEPEKNWKFSVGDIKERAFWADYMKAFEEAANATSRPWAPWYSIPADDKHFARMTVSEIVVQTAAGLGLAPPRLAKADRARLAEMRAILDAE